MNYYFIIFLTSYIVLQSSAETYHRFKPECKYNEQDLTVKGSIGEPLDIDVLPPAFDEVTITGCQFDTESHYDNGYYDIDPSWNSLTHERYAEQITFPPLEGAKSCSFTINSLDAKFIDRWIIKTSYKGVNKSKEKITGQKDDRVDIIDKSKEKKTGQKDDRVGIIDKNKPREDF